ncbi:MAG: hypothetical protein H6Q20_166 [Bacteroidetes bacterium]|nr:hypothetical protein [Bacteroidota bacterium]
MKKGILFFLLICSVSLYSQNRRGLYGTDRNTQISSIVVGAGPAYLFGDIGGEIENQAVFRTSDWDIIKTRYMFSLGYRLVFPNNLGLKATLFYGSFEGMDVGTSNHSRGYFFNANAAEFTLYAEYILYGGPFNTAGNPHTVFIYGGAGILKNHVYHYPTLIRPYDTQKLDVVTPTLPFGLGYTYSLNSNFAVGVDIGWHIAFTDFLDGISSGASQYNDLPAYLNLTVSYTITGGKGVRRNCNCNR